MVQKVHGAEIICRRYMVQKVYGAEIMCRRYIYIYMSRPAVLYRLI